MKSLEQLKREAEGNVKPLKITKDFQVDTISSKDLRVKIESIQKEIDTVNRVLEYATNEQGILNMDVLLYEVFQKVDVYFSNEYFIHNLKKPLMAYINKRIGDFVDEKELPEMFREFRVSEYYEGVYALILPQHLKILKENHESFRFTATNVALIDNLKGSVVSFDENSYQKYVADEITFSKDRISEWLVNLDVLTVDYQIVTMFEEGKGKSEIVEYLKNISNEKFDFDVVQQYYKYDNRLERVANKIKVTYLNIHALEQTVSLLSKWQPYYEGDTFLQDVEDIVIFVNNLLGTNITTLK